MKVPARLARLRRMLLRRYLADARLDADQVAVDLGYSIGYMRDLLNGARPVSDMAAWRLQHRLGVPLSVFEAPPLVPPLPALVRARLDTDVVHWRESCLPGE